MIKLELNEQEARDLSFALEQHLITIEQEPEQLEEALDADEGDLEEHELSIIKLLKKVNRALAEE